MLELKGLELAQGDFRLSANWTAQPGERIAVIGPSGGGKSTLLAGLGGFLQPVSGQLLWQGKRIDEAAPGARPMSSVFQDNNLFGHLSVAQNVGLGIGPQLSHAGDARVDVALERVGLGGFGQRLPGALSGGQQSRAALARVLVAQRPIVLMDEPFAALGPGLRAQMLDLVAQILTETERMMIMVTHAPDDARRIADKVCFVHAGIAQPPAPTEAIFSDPPPGLAAYLGQSNGR
ncbi:MAG: ATP-binding cassette domain-containing protein [Rhodobacteraceae bacterium]|nr:ATP-binding cassette domain-containing protein [Paracoccaceae bacterium]